MFKTILIPVDGEKNTYRCLEIGLRLARQFNSHVTGLHLRSDPQDTIPYLGEGMSLTMIEEMISISEKEGKVRSGAAKQAFNKIFATNQVGVFDSPTGQGISAQWIDEVGRADDKIAAYGRVNDLIVVSQPEAIGDISTNLTLHASIFETGRPVLVAPIKGSLDIGQRIVISWNGSPQSARAVGVAMPFLKSAELVTIFSVNDESCSQNVNLSLVSYLAVHGVEARLHSINGSPSVVGLKLMDNVKNEQADLLVMGAYTRSRMRQLILGGVTRYVLEQSNVPVLMAH